MTFHLKDDFARQPVPLAERRKWFLITLVWIGVGTDIFAAVIGLHLADGQTVLGALIALLIANVILGIIGGYCAYIGSATGLSTGMITRFAFGTTGGRLVTWVIVLVWFTINGASVSLLGESAQYTLQAIGIPISVSWAAVLGGLLVTITATVGYIAIERLSMVAVPLMLFLLGGLIGKVIGTENKGEWLHAVPTDGISLSMGSAISFIVASWMIVVVITPDIARWAKSKRDAYLSGFFGFLIGNSLMIGLSVIIIRITGVETVIDIFLSVGWGILAIFTIILAQWTTMDNALYSIGLGLSSLIRAPKYLLTMITGLIGCVLGYFQIHQWVAFLINISGILLAPIAAVYMVEYFFLNRSRFLFAFIRDSQLKPIYWTALTSWIIAALIGLMTTPPGEGGFGLFQLTTAASLDAFLAAGIIHFLIGTINERFNGPQREVTNV
ncbi:cytosine permease [Desmospora activa]|nr:cytosine permease [Desmospora activa]